MAFRVSNSALQADAGSAQTCPRHHCWRFSTRPLLESETTSLRRGVKQILLRYPFVPCSVRMRAADEQAARGLRLYFAPRPTQPDTRSRSTETYVSRGCLHWQRDRGEKKRRQFLSHFVEEKEGIAGLLCAIGRHTNVWSPSSISYSLLLKNELPGEKRARRWSRFVTGTNGRSDSNRTSFPTVYARTVLLITTVMAVDKALT